MCRATSTGRGWPRCRCVGGVHCSFVLLGCSWYLVHSLILGSLSAALQADLESAQRDMRAAQEETERAKQELARVRQQLADAEAQIRDQRQYLGSLEKKIDVSACRE